MTATNMHFSIDEYIQTVEYHTAEFSSEVRTTQQPQEDMAKL